MECCLNCRYRYMLTKFDYSQGGCEHTAMEGYVCMAFADDGQAVWMAGIDPRSNKCAAYEQRVRLRGMRGQ